MVSATKHAPPAAVQPPAFSSSTSAAAADTREPPHADSRKRKRGDDGPAALAQRSIAIRPCPASPYDRPLTLSPVKLIDRAQLPLFFLDVAGVSSAIPSSSTRLFSAYIEALERRPSDEEEEDVPPAPKVLIARFEADKSLYAVERARYGVYALCKLGSWVKETDIGSVVPASAASVPYKQPVKACKREDGGGLWWQCAAVEGPPEKRRGQGPKISMRRPVPKIKMVDADPFVDAAAVEAGHTPAEVLEERPQTAEEVFQAVVQQYLDALYLSKTSLAFFVKGPMSRARAAFTATDNASMKMGDLVAFMRSILLQPGPMDKKHRERLPEIIKSMPLPGLSDDEDVARTEKKARKSKSKRLKPSKEGMYPGEEGHVKKWWLQDRPGSSPSGQSESPADILKRRLGELRVRESMAQVILVLEVMALEASPSFQAADQEDTQQDETQAELQSAPAKKRKPKKPQDLNVLLDLLLDRLCIWQSVEQDETLVKIPKSGSGKNDALTPNSSKTGTSDKLKNFCVEVILPFYMSRLPEKAASVNKRLGGPSASPAKISGSGSTSHRSKPGEAAVRTDPRSAQRKRRPLSRVATENAAHQPARPSSLNRSSTDPILPPAFKREGSEAPSLSSIPLQQKDSQASSSRNSLSQFERFSRRTIDLDAMSKTNEAKLKKKAHIEQELEKAIGTLRKPNRGAALKDVADSADSRRLSSRKPAAASAIRKPGAPMERSAVLVGATPKRARKTKDVAAAAAVQATPNHRWAASLAQHHGTPNGYYDDAVPPSSDPVIPSSAIRPSPFVPGSAVPASVVKSGMNASSERAGGVEETPSRGPAGKTVRWGLASSGGAGEEGGVGVAATPEAGVSKLGERLRAGGGAGGSKTGLLKVPPPPAFNLPGAPVLREMARGDEESEGSEDEFRGIAAMLRTPTKAGRGQVLETPLKKGGVVGKSPAKDVAMADGENKGKETAIEGRGSQGDAHDAVGGAEVEDTGEVSIYSALGWDDDADELV